MTTNSNDWGRQPAQTTDQGSACKDRENKLADGHKEIPTVVTAKYTGDFKTVASQAERKIPDNSDEVIARNTKQVVGR